MSRFSTGVLIAGVIAEREARRARFDMIEPDHLWIGLTKLSEFDESLALELDIPEDERPVLTTEIETVARWFAGKGIDTAENRRLLRKRLGEESGSADEPRRSPASHAAFRKALELAQEDDPKDSDGIEKDWTANAVNLAEAIYSDPPDFLGSLLAISSANASPHRRDEEPGASRPVKRERKRGKSVLDRLGRDLTQLARQEALSPLVGRKEETRRLAQILSQKTKGNAVLVGEAGVGKTCIVEGLAQRGAHPNARSPIKNWRIVEIPVASLVAGTKYRGDFEERMQEIVKEAEDPNVILFLDELHTLMGAGGGSGNALNAANILKPALGSGRIRIIGATTTPEYERHLARDEALARRFEVLWVNEPSRDEAVEILRGLKPGLEEHHGVTISNEALATAVDLSIRYMHTRRLPDKAIDLVDQACTQRVIPTLSPLSRPQNEGASAAAPERLEVDRTNVLRVVSARCRIPEALLMASEDERLEALEDFLLTRIIGQDAALRPVASAIRAAYKGLRDPRRPISSFLFMGPTGVGKTETAKALSEFLFGPGENLVRIDLSEYTEKHQVARLIGSPPGYVGYEEAGRLTTALRQRPACVVLFDEMEKAHADVLNVLLQILDEGELTDGQGRKASFREAFVILTTNIQPEKRKEHMGFRPAAAADAESKSLGRTEAIQALSRHLRPELLGRIRHIVRFDALAQEDLGRIVDRVVAANLKRLEDHGVEVAAMPKLRDRVLKRAKDLRFGAREIEQIVESELARRLDEKGDRAVWSLFNAIRGSAQPELDSASNLMPASQTEAGLLVMDLVNREDIVARRDEKHYSKLIEVFGEGLKKGPGADELDFLKCTGDGYLAVYGDMNTAFHVGRSLLATATKFDVSLCVALQWGRMKTGRDGEPSGVEVHRAFRVQALREEDRVPATGHPPPIPKTDRILASASAYDALAPSRQADLWSLGSFRLKGFDDPCEIWAYHEIPMTLIT